jgi:hypothetical protein
VVLAGYLISQNPVDALDPSEPKQLASLLDFALFVYLKKHTVGRQTVAKFFIKIN